MVTGSLRATTGVLLAAEHPERVAALVLVHGAARLERAPDYPCGIPSDMLRWFVDAAPDPDASGATDDLALMAPSLADDGQYRRWWSRASHRAASPTAAREHLVLNSYSDVRDRLADVVAPTLVVHRRDNPFLRVGHGRYLAEHVGGARYVELAGQDHVPGPATPTPCSPRSSGSSARTVARASSDGSRRSCSATSSRPPSPPRSSATGPGGHGSTATTSPCAPWSPGTAVGW